MRVLILGSGFSASFGIPTLLGLFDEILRHPDRLGEEDIANVHNAISWFYPEFRPLAHAPAYPPFEEFLSLVVASEGLPSFETGYWERIRRSALRRLTDYFTRSLPAAENDPLLLEFASRLRPGDVVVTFNWDNLVERALLRLGRPISLDQTGPDRVSLIKLHGSINWVRAAPPWKLDGPVAVAELGHGVYRTLDYLPYDVWDALDSPPLIVPPIASKAPLADEFLNPLWWQAALAIRASETLSVIGYSLPDQDLQARALICTSCQARTRGYRIVDPNPEVAARYRRWLGRLPQTHLEKPFDSEVLDRILPK